MRLTSWNFALVASLGAMLLATSLFPIASWDLPWHLRVGQDILATGSFPTGDVYSFTRPGGMYVEDEWLFQVGAHLLQQAFGFRAMTYAKAALFLVACGLLLLETRALTGSTAVASLLVALSAAASRSRLLERPDVLNLLFFPALLVAVSAYRRSGDRRFLLVLPPLFGIWANCHSGVTLGLLVLAAMAAADVACRLGRVLLNEASAGSPWELLATAAACLPATLVNPIGTRILTFPFEVVGVHRTVEWQHTPLEMFPLFFLLGGLFLAGSALTLRNLDLAELGAYGTLLALGMRHVRMLGIFAIVACIPIARAVGNLTGRLPIPRSAWARDTYRQRLYALASAILLGAALHYLVVNDYHPIGAGLAEDHFPEAAADFMLRERPPAPMWNEFTLGGWLLFRLFPAYRVFIDNREEPYYTLLDEIQKAMKSPAAFAAHLDRHQVNVAIVRPRTPPFLTRAADGTPVERGWSLFFPEEQWPLVHWDDVAMVMVRRSAADAGWVARHEVRGFRPDEWRSSLEEAARDGAARERLRGELSSKLREDPTCDRARGLLALLDRLPVPEIFGPDLRGVTAIPRHEGTPGR